MKTLDSSKYFNLVSNKYNLFAQSLNDGFNKANKISPLEDPGQRVAELHALILNGKEFDESLFTEEEYKAEEIIRAEETRRLNAILDGTMVTYSPNAEELNILVVTPAEILECMISEEEYKEELLQYTQDGTKA